MAKYVLSENEQLIVDNVSIPMYYNRFIVPEHKGFREISEGNKSGICPFHDDTDPSLYFYSATKSFTCFGCKVSGNVITMHKRIQKQKGRYLTTISAVKELASLFNVELVLDEVTGEVKEENAFELARKKMSDRSSCTKNAHDLENMSVAGFRVFNAQVKGQIQRMPYMTGKRAADMYYKLDLSLSTFLAESKARASGKGAANV